MVLISERGWIMKIKDVMKRKVSVVSENLHLYKALERMKQNNTGILLVKDNHHVEGVLAVDDVLMRRGINKEKLKKLQVRDVMNPNVHLVYEDQYLLPVRTMMKEKNITRLIVLNRKNKITGICTLSDVQGKSINSN